LPERPAASPGTLGTLAKAAISGQKDHTVPDSVTHATFGQYRHSTAVTDLRRIAGRGHSLTIDGGWREVASTALTWLHAHQL
jgi:hypothetical protein